MNFLVPSVQVFENSADFGELRSGCFDWIVFDEPNGILGLDYRYSAPESEKLTLI
jgi:hypothetical protein